MMTQAEGQGRTRIGAWARSRSTSSARGSAAPSREACFARRSRNVFVFPKRRLPCFSTGIALRFRRVSRRGFEISFPIELGQVQENACRAARTMSHW